MDASEQSDPYRPYLGAEDLAPLLAFGSRAFAQRFPLNANWHPGDFVWELHARRDRPQPIRMWDRAGGVTAVAWFTGPAQLLCEVLPDSENLVPQIVAYAENAAGDQAELSIRAFDSDVGRITALQRLGYRRAAPEGVWFCMDLSAPLPAFHPPDGFSVRDSVGIDAARRAAAHRDAWNDLSRIGLPDARSAFTTEAYLSLRAAPVYDPGLDILLQAPDGGLVANCICWEDAHSGIGVFEPVGTHAAFRGRGLARQAILEGCRRLRARGHRWARVGTAHFNAPAISAYRSCGFEEYDHTSWWNRALS
ncbi:MAG TPA: GNAT family N-acetyltransferase [Caulobacteraceae bacterium]|nr:GNAT family N-acetyltransferase [Caulobacteraceae bacterium]